MQIIFDIMWSVLCSNLLNRTKHLIYHLLCPKHYVNGLVLTVCTTVTENVFTFGFTFILNVPSTCFLNLPLTRCSLHAQKHIKVDFYYQILKHVMVSASRDWKNIEGVVKKPASMWLFPFIHTLTWMFDQPADSVICFVDVPHTNTFVDHYFRGRHLIIASLQTSELRYLSSSMFPAADDVCSPWLIMSACNDSQL